MANHIAFIMDGNGRWATERGMERMNGHAAGYDVIEPLIEHAIKNKVQEITLFAMSHENFMHRPNEEIAFLLDLFCQALKEQNNKLVDEGVCLRIIGDMTPMPEKVKQSIKSLKRPSDANRKINVNLAINYSGQWHIEDAARAWAQDACKGEFGAIIESVMRPIDIVVRTGKEMRLSNSFLWHLAYAECFFPDVFWPDFNTQHFDEILSAYSKRQRRFGRTPCQIQSSES